MKIGSRNLGTMRPSSNHRRHKSTAITLKVFRELQLNIDELLQAQSENEAANNALTEVTEKLEKQLFKAGKEQFKANALAETLQQTLTTGLERLRHTEAIHERELADLRAKIIEANNGGRFEVIKSFLPALDGLNEAIAAGKRLLERCNVAPRLSFMQRLRLAGKLLFGKMAYTEATAPPAADRSIVESVCAWLAGLELVEQRLLELLAAENVHVIKSEQQMFNPHRHVAIETIAANDKYISGIVARELRRGYVKDDCVLRYAEVVVAR